MKINNKFDVPLSLADTWRVLMDIPRIVLCMPGAELIEKIDERTFKGKVSVRLGPVLLAFIGTARFEDIDEAARCARVKARGVDAKGRGNASATVDFKLVASGEGKETRVDVVTDVTLTGAVAQYGRATGIIQDVAIQLVAQFAESLRRSLVADDLARTVADAKSATALAQPGPSSPNPAPSRAISGLSLLGRTVWRMLVGLFRRERRV